MQRLILALIILASVVLGYEIAGIQIYGKIVSDTKVIVGI